ncbi:MAG TPA: hypothetical protein VG937_35485 [Polyangiaceae bacterium]|nr:hypothetical protein [Polyangiaceae bacterium]
MTAPVVASNLSQPSGSSPAAPARAGSISRVEGALVLASFIALTVYMLTSPLRIGWDAANYAQAADEILRGRVPFRDIVDINPPLVQFLHVPAALLGRLIQRPVLAFNLYVLACAALSAVALNWLLLQPALGVSTQRRFVVLFTFVFTNHIAWEGGHFGQREHFVVLALIPLLVLRWLRHEAAQLPARLAFSLGFVAGTALLVKPHYLLPLAGFELVWLYRHRHFRRLFGEEAWGMLAAAVAYAGLFLAFPSMRSEFFGRYLPLFAAGYRVYDCSTRDLFLLGEVWIGLAGASLALFSPGKLDASPIVRPFGAFLIGSVLVYLAQHKGWPYQVFPAFALAPLAVAWLSPLAPRIPALLAVAALGSSVWWCANLRDRPLPSERRFSVLRDALRIMTRPGEAALILTTSALGPYPMQLQLGVRPGSRFAWLPLLPMFYPQGEASGCAYRKWGEGLPAERRLLQDLTADIRERKPVFIAIESQEAQAMRIGCTPLEWARESGFIERAMGDYVPLPPAPGFELWGIRGGRQVPGLESARGP